MDSSILSFPNRGPWGDSSYRGNCSGHVIKKLLEHYQPETFVDPAQGSGTSGEVALEMGIPYVGLDLKDGFDLLTDSLIEKIKVPVDMVFFHPPYHNIIQYSGAVWGAEHPSDLSRSNTYQKYIAKLHLACLNIYDAIRTGGRIAILIGDIRHKGRYYSPQAEIQRFGLGKLEAILIKAQHNMRSNGKKYSGKFIPIMHEYLLVFRRN